MIFACAIFFNGLGERRDCTLENQRHRASGLTLLAHLAQLGWEHIGLTRDYMWSEDRRRAVTGKNAIPS